MEFIGTFELRKSLPIVDSFNRTHTNLRISVTDRCNIRCVYCMPEFVRFLPQSEVLTFEEIARVVSILAPLGVNKIRLTGGEPLVRAKLSVLVEMIQRVKGIQDVAITTNGILLASQARDLKQAGLSRINISLDTIDRALFEKVTRRDMVGKVLEGIDAAIDAGFEKIRINAVPVPMIDDASLVALAKFAKAKKLELRFIEYMPLDGDKQWSEDAVRSGSELRKLVEREVGRLERAERNDPSQPALDYRYVDDDVRIGFIDSVTAPFCGTCNRMRLTAEGKFRNCLFSNAEWDLKTALRTGSDDEVESIVRTAIAAKKAGHGTDDFEFFRPERSMFQIGG